MIAPIEQNRIGRPNDENVVARPQNNDDYDDQSLQVVRNVIGNHPVAALAAAAAVGAAAAWIIKRGVRS